jgi:hypothetical protein
VEIAMNTANVPKPTDSRAACDVPPRRIAVRLILYLLLYLVAIDGLVASQRRLWRRYDPDEYEERVRACADREQDLVVVGGSPACEGLDPAVLAGLDWNGKRLDRVYNLALAGATTSEVWHAVKHGIAKPPELLVYGITASDLNDGRDEPHGPWTLMTFSDIVDWVHWRPETAEWCIRQYGKSRLARLWQLFYYRNAIRSWACDQLERARPGLCRETAGTVQESLAFSTALQDPSGYAPRFRDARLDLRKAAGEAFDRFPFLKDYHLGGHLNYLRRLVDWANEHTVTLLLVDMPVSAYLEERLHPDAYAAYRAVLIDLERDCGINVIRANRHSLGLEDSSFADLIHLNGNGARRLSAWLRQEISSRSQQAIVGSASYRPSIISRSR